jgi:hypothetical protein
MRGSLGNLTWREPRIVALALLVVIAAGLSAILTIGRQEDPTITNLFATVTTPYPGAEPARVEALVTAEIEEALREIAEVDVIDSTSATGISLVSIELLETLARGPDRTGVVGHPRRAVGYRSPPSRRSASSRNWTPTAPGPTGRSSP